MRDTEFDQPMIKNIRKSLGKAKCTILDEWPYRREVRRMGLYREQMRSKLYSLPSIPQRSGEKIEIHMLCGKRDLDMGIWASWSLFRFLEGKGQLFIHSDGSLCEADLELWREKIAGLSLIGRRQSKEAVAELLSSRAPILYEWAQNNLPGIQLIDTHLFGEEEVFLILDSDVLCFKKPQVLLDRLQDSTPPFAWCRDLCDAYSCSSDLINEVTGVRVPPRVNHGVFVNPRLGFEDFMWLERKLEMIKSDGRIDLNHFWSSQTYVALIAGMKGNSCALPDEYSVRSRRGCKADVLRHYVGVPRIRYRYFKEGLPRIIADLTESGS